MSSSVQDAHLAQGQIFWGLQVSVMVGEAKEEVRGLKEYIQGSY